MYTKAAIEHIITQPQHYISVPSTLADLVHHQAGRTFCQWHHAVTPQPAALQKLTPFQALTSLMLHFMLKQC
jgi:hypothetical protein